MPAAERKISLETARLPRAPAVSKSASKPTLKPDRAKKTAPIDWASLEDAELVNGILCGSEAHFTQLYNRYFRRVYGFVYNRFGNSADVEEIVQETFTAVFESIGNFQSRASLLSWIFGIARNTANNHVRRQKVRNARTEEIEPEFVQAVSSLANCSPEDQLHMRRLVDDMCERLDSVAEWQSEIFVMRHFEDLSIREICERTQRSSDAVRSSLYRVKNELLQAPHAGGTEVSNRRPTNLGHGGAS